MNTVLGSVEEQLLKFCSYQLQKILDIFKSLLKVSVGCRMVIFRLVQNGT